MEYLDKANLEQEESLYNAYLDDVGIGKKVSIGVSLFRDDYEVFVDHWDKKPATTYYCATFDEALEYCKQEYPDADWDVIG